MQDVRFRDLRLIDYQSAWDIQESLLQENIKIKSDARQLLSELSSSELPTTHHLLFCEHTPVYTLGKSGNEKNILYSAEEMKARNIQYFKTNRGGDITFHGPGQLVGYPIFDLEKIYTDIGKYLRSLEEAIIQTLAEYNIIAGRSKGETGVWLSPENPSEARKICAIGVRCSRWITMHGFALNVNTDLAYFDGIIPCGIENKQVTSIKKELGEKVNFEVLKAKVKANLALIFDLKYV